MSDSGLILVVCTGNVCRSPFVERYLDLHLRNAVRSAINQVAVASAGTAALVGAPMDERVAARVAGLGADPSGFVARQLTAEMVAAADLVLAATRGHRAKVVTLDPRALRCCFTVREFAALLDSADGDGVGHAESSREYVRRLAAAAAARRGFVVPLSDSEADIVDPYRRPDEVYDTMQAQILEAMPPIVAALAG